MKKKSVPRNWQQWVDKLWIPALIAMVIVVPFAVVKAAKLKVNMENEMEKEFNELEKRIKEMCDKYLVGKHPAQAEQPLLELLSAIKTGYVKLEKEADDLNDDNQTLTAQNDELQGENVENKDVLLKAFADHRNWDGNTFLPPEAKFAISAPDQLADRVLNGDTI